MNLPETKTDLILKNYLPQFSYEKPGKINSVAELNSDYTYLKNLLNDLCEVIKQIGFDGTIIFIDKVDEFKAISGNVEKIANFIKSVLMDTELLLNQNYSFVISIWDEIKKELNSSGVRFDKFRPIDISWNDDDMISIMEKRLNYFSLDNIKHYSLNRIIENEKEIFSIIALANRSPRDLILLLSYIYDEQTIIDENSTILSSDAIEKAKKKYCIEYAYYSHYPTKKRDKGRYL